MSIRVYVITRDYGFAPNPFHGCCTLATCKQRIRENVRIGDFIVGIGSKTTKYAKKMIFYMQVEEKIKYDEYWQKDEFEIKKAIIQGSKKMQYGDNIYHKVEGVWMQENSHHSLDDGSINPLNLNRDTKSEFVVLSRENWSYYGSNAIKLPSELEIVLCPDRNRGHRHISDQNFITVFHDFVRRLEKGYMGKPIKWLESERFQRYDGH